MNYLENETNNRATYILPAGTFAESDGTVINNELRAQRFYKVYVPDNDVKSSWEWLLKIMPEGFSEEGYSP